MQLQLLLLAIIPALVASRINPAHYQPNQPSERNQNLLECWENPSRTGDSVRLISHAANLGDYNFYKRAVYCCFTGVWVLYENTNFNYYNPGALSYYGWGQNNCQSLGTSFYKKAASARQVGSLNGIFTDSLNLFSGEYFNGLYATTDQSHVYRFASAPLGRSAIVTGQSPWTLYANEGYTGTCACIYPGASPRPGFYFTSSQLSFMAGAIVSAQKGCFCSSTPIRPPQS